ncbi:PucR-like helix-turn-helix protein [Subtercola boreus]|nr:PucR-like helix-turn-helix protein [Subtercola boreus]
MQELVGRITALDPVASDSLRVISYFDTLVEGHASAEALLRAASVLTGCGVGFVAEETVMRVDSAGARSADPGVPEGGRWPSHAVGEGWYAWIERSGSAHVNDAMVLERLSFGLRISLERTHPVAIARRNLEILIDAAESPDARAAAARRLRVDTGLLRLVAAPAADSGAEPGAGSVVVDTLVGRVRARIVREGAGAPLGRLGLGLLLPATDAPRSWQTALLALRLSTEAEPVIDASALGGMLLLAEAAETSSHPQPDVEAIDRLVQDDPRNLANLELLVRAESVRAAAASTGVHHSTMQARVSELSERLGFDVRSSEGRVRLSLALRLHHLATNRF